MNSRPTDVEWRASQGMGPQVTQRPECQIRYAHGGWAHPCWRKDVREQLGPAEVPGCNEESGEWQTRKGQRMLRSVGKKKLDEGGGGSVWGWRDDQMLTSEPGLACVLLS